MREFDLLNSVIAAAGDSPEWLSIPPGDDMAGIKIGEREFLLAVDQVIDGIHIDVEQFGVEAAARKVMLRNLSDVAAMGGVPMCAVVAVAMPGDWHQDQGETLLKSLKCWGEYWDCPVIGGDLSMHAGPLQLSVTVMAEVMQGHHALLRQGATAGDHLYVSGRLGGAWLPDGSGPHLEKEPRLRLGQSLSRDAVSVGACIDLSDGLAGDLMHVLQASVLSAVVELEQLPLSETCLRRAELSGKPAWWHAISDGEDYELLFTGPEALNVDEITPDSGVTKIGVMITKSETDGVSQIIYRDEGQIIEVESGAWEHHGD